MTDQALDRSVVVGVIGAGAMGAGIAQVAAQAGHRVLMVDAQPGAVERAIAQAASSLKALADKGKVPAEHATAIPARMRAATLPELAECGLVIEAIVEDMDVKRGLFRDLEAIVGPRCILATNTSSLSVTAMAAGLKQPERVVGMHFFNPPTRMRLVEVISGLETAPRRRAARLPHRRRRGASTRRTRSRRRASSSTASRGRSTARRGAPTPRARPIPPRSTPSCATAAASRWGRSS